MKIGDKVTLIKSFGYDKPLIVTQISDCGTSIKMKHQVTGVTVTRSNNEGEWFLVSEINTNMSHSDITILDEYKEVESDIVFTGEDSEGTLFSVTIPTADIANYFEVEEIRIDEDADYHGAAQSVFDAWIQDSKQHDIEIKELITTK